MIEVLEKIQSRGYWKVVIRPGVFCERRVASRSDLLTILRNTAVELKGWNFPHVDSFIEIGEGPDWVGQEVDLGDIVEFWRFYQSGQFVHYFGMLEDWRNGRSRPLSASGEGHRIGLGVKDILLRFTEIFELAARFVFTAAGDQEMRLHIAANNLQQHFLELREFNSGKASWIPEAKTDSMDYARCFSMSELAAQPKELALAPALEFFRCFQWNPDIGFLRDIQASLHYRGTQTNITP